MSETPTFPHQSWSRNSVDMSDEVENLYCYVPGGFHPVVLGSTFKSGRYTVVHKLGSGGLATVWLVWDQLESRYVSLKILRANELETSKEVRIHQYLARLNINLEDNFICPLYDDFLHKGPHGTHICLVFPLAANSVTWEVDMSFPQTHKEKIELARQYGRQIAHAVAFLHSVGIVHGDLTGSNVLTQISKHHYASLDELYNVIGEPDRVKAIYGSKNPDVGPIHLVRPADLSKLPRTGKVLVTDFGGAFFIDCPPSIRLGIPIIYAAPEVLYEDNAVEAASPAVDIWALGCLLFEWCCRGRTLFDGSDQEQISSVWTTFLGKLPQPYWNKYKGRKKLFDEQGKLRPKKASPHVADNVTDLSHWLNILWRQKNGYGEAHSRVNPQFMPWHPDHWPIPPQFAVSVNRSMTRKRSIVTRIMPNITSYVSATIRLNDQSDHTNTAEHVRPAGEGASLDGSLSHSRPERSQTSLSRCSPMKPPIQLDPDATDFYCLLMQMLVYDPNKRLPAFMVLKHHWFSDSPERCELQATTTTKEGRIPTLFGSKAGESEVAESEASVLTRWSLAYDAKSQTWEYFRNLEEPIKESSGD